MIYTPRVSAFSFYLKKKTPAKEKQTQGCAQRPRERRAAVLSLRLSINLCTGNYQAQKTGDKQSRDNSDNYFYTLFHIVTP